MEKIKIAFFGTHKFAREILENLSKNQKFDIKFVITQPDKPVGRKQEISKSPVKIFAEENKIPVFEPKSLKNFILPEKIDIGITAQYGLILPEKILSEPKFGILNVHTSLLPKYRGASPIQTALLNNEKITGITIMKMDIGLDTGDILKQKEIIIDEDDTYPILEQKLIILAQDFLAETIVDYIQGKITINKQDETKATFCKQLDRNDGKIDFKNETSQNIYNKYRAFFPWPGIWAEWQGKRIKLLNIKPSKEKITAGEMKINTDKLFIGTASSAIEIFELQIEGKKSMTAQAFINGYKNLI
ncbi:MAG: methionyl-tRNA formyltransferase [Patescibacteria group bacterium]